MAYCMICFQGWRSSECRSSWIVSFLRYARFSVGGCQGDGATIVRLVQRSRRGSAHRIHPIRGPTGLDVHQTWKYLVCFYSVEEKTNVFSTSYLSFIFKVGLFFGRMLGSVSIKEFIIDLLIFKNNFDVVVLRWSAKFFLPEPIRVFCAR